MDVNISQEKLPVITYDEIMNKEDKKGMQRYRLYSYSVYVKWINLKLYVCSTIDS